jgi:hypothetical protein
MAIKRKLALPSEKKSGSGQSTPATLKRPPITTPRRRRVLTKIKEISEELLKSVSGKSSLDPMAFMQERMKFSQEELNDLAVVINRGAKESAAQSPIMAEMRQKLVESMLAGQGVPNYPVDEVANSLMDAAGIGMTRGYIEGFIAGNLLSSEKNLTDSAE